MNGNIELKNQDQSSQIQALVTSIISSAQNIKLIASHKRFEDISFNIKIIDKSLKNIKKTTAEALKFTKKYIKIHKTQILNQNLQEFQEDLQGILEPNMCRGDTEGSEIDMRDLRSLNTSQFSDSLDGRSLDTDGHIEEMMQEMQEMDITILYLEKRLSRLSGIEEKLNPFYDDKVDEGRIRLKEVTNIAKKANQCAYYGGAMRYDVRIGTKPNRIYGPVVG